MIFIAEIGMNHNGNYNLIYELIRQAKYSGANIVKLQLGWRDGEGEINQITDEILTKIFKWCAYFEIEFMSSLITEKAFERARKFSFNRYKVASRTVIDNIDLVNRIVKEGKETIISLGMWDKDKPPVPKANNVKFLWCKSKYPTEPWDLSEFPKNFNDSIYDGYSDHTIGIDMPLIAISRGARIIEKHFTLDKSDTSIRDHALSATPDEFRQMVIIGNEIFKKIQLGI